MTYRQFASEFDAFHSRALRSLPKVPRRSRYYPLVSRLLCLELEARSYPEVKRYLSSKRFN